MKNGMDLVYVYFYEVAVECTYSWECDFMWHWVQMKFLFPLPVWQSFLFCQTRGWGLSSVEQGLPGKHMVVSSLLLHTRKKSSAPKFGNSIGRWAVAVLSYTNKEILHIIYGEIGLCWVFLGILIWVNLKLDPTNKTQWWNSILRLLPFLLLLHTMKNACTLISLVFWVVFGKFSFN